MYYVRNFVLRMRPPFAISFPICRARRWLRHGLLAAILAGTLGATPILSVDPFSGPWDIVAQARNGRTGWEAALFSPDNAPTYMNPYGAPVWSYGNPYPFHLQYLYATGTTIWSIDFNRNGAFEPGESAIHVSASLAGRSFRYLNLFIQGNNQGNGPATATAQDLSVNGVSFGTFTSGNSVLQVLFTDSQGLFGNLDVRGSLIFSANGNSDERPRLWLRLGSAEPFQEPADPSPVPEPSTLMLPALGLVTLTLFETRRRRAGLR